MRASRIQYTRGDKGHVAFRFMAGLAFAIAGFFLFQPFFWNVIVFGSNYHYMTWSVLLMIVGCIVGLPMFFGGIIAMLMGNSNASPSTYGDHDMSRIRHAVETERMKE